MATGVGTPAITISAAVFTAGSAGNYTITYVPGTLTITPAPLTVTATSASRTYGAANPAFTFTSATLLNGDTIGSVTEGTAATVATGVGTPAITISAAVFSAGSAANYAISYVPGTLTITPAALTVTATSASRTYGAANPAFTFTSATLLNGDTIAKQAITEGTAATVATGVGTPTITISAAVFTAAGSAGNYTITYVPGTLTITPAPLTVTATSTSRAYGAANPAFTFTSATLLNGDTIGSVTEGTGATVGTGVGTPTITISAAVFTAGSAGNYTITYVPGTLTITPAPLTVTATSASRAYGSANPAFTFTSATLLNGDTIGSVTEGTAATVGTGIGTPAITISAAVFTVGSAGNYTITYVPGTLTITPVTLTVTGSTQAMQSGGTVPTPTFAITGFVNGETISVVGGTLVLTATATPASAPGNYPNTVTTNTLSASNYTFTIATPGSINVAANVLTLTADPQSMVYGSAVPTLTFTVTGFQLGDTLANATNVGSGGAPTLACTATSASPVGGYTIVAGIGTLTANNPAKYAFALANGTLTVTPAALTVTGATQTKAYGAAVPTLTAAITGFVNGDTLAVVTGAPALTNPVTAASPVATYTTTVGAGTLSASNYTFTLVNGSVQVTTAALTVTASSQTKAYGAAVPTLTDAITGFVNGDTQAVVTGAPTLTNPVTAASAVGNYSTTVGAGTLSASNYTFTLVNGSVQVTPVALTITADNQTMTEGGTVPTLTVTYGGFVNGDTAASLTTAPTVTTTGTSASAPGAYPITPSGAADANYVITEVNGTLTIQAAAGTATAGNVTSGPINGTGSGGTSSGCGLGAGGMGVIGLMLLALRALRPRSARRP